MNLHSTPKEFQCHIIFARSTQEYNSVDREYMAILCDDNDVNRRDCFVHVPTFSRKTCDGGVYWLNNDEFKMNACSCIRYDVRV